MDGVTLATLDMDAVLCLVGGERGPKHCHFTTKPLAEQWGDDWNDAPHQCNAGAPYVEDCSIYTVLVEGACFADGEWSVDELNVGRAPWLEDGCSWEPNDKTVYAGITLRDFVRKCQEYGWTVYWPLAASEETP